MAQRRHAWVKDPATNHSYGYRCLHCRLQVVTASPAALGLVRRPCAGGGASRPPGGPPPAHLAPLLDLELS